jgi:hypothetical protein
VQLDLERRSRERPEGQEDFASNAEALVDLNEVTKGRSDAETTSYLWRYNPVVADGAGAGQSLADLKQRLGEALVLRERQESQTLDYDVEIAQATTITGKDAAAALNAVRLNDALALDQSRNYQRGAVAQQELDKAPQQQALYMGQTVQLEPSNFTPPEEPAGDPGRSTGAALNPSLGLQFDDVTDGEDGDFRARTENVFDGPAGVGVGGGAGGRFETTTRSGLLGIDVALPRQGRVLYFRSLQGGAPIRLDASRRGLAAGWRWALFGLLLLSGSARVTGASVAWRRRRRRA